MNPLHRLLVPILGLLAVSTHAQTFNISTGVNPAAGIEQNYTIVAAPPALSVPYAPWAFSNAAGFPVGGAAWFANNGSQALTGYSDGTLGTSAWISGSAPVAGSGEWAPVGNYTFQVTFTLPANLSSLTSISLYVAADNPLYDGDAVTAGIQGAKLNGTYLNVSTPQVQPFQSFSPLFTFDNSDGKFISGGTNTLQFFVENLAGATGNPVGLRVQGQVNAIVIPEPSTYALFLGIITLSLAARRRFAATA